MNVARRIDVYAKIPRLDVKRRRGRGGERRPPDIARIEPQREMVHRRIVDEHHLVHIRSREARLFRHVRRQRVQRLDNGGLQLFPALRLRRRIGNARQHILAVADLRIHARRFREHFAGCQVAEERRQRRRADVHRRAEARFPLPRRDADDLFLLPDRRRHRPASRAENLRQFLQYRIIDGKMLQPRFFFQRVEKALPVVAKIGKRRGGKRHRDIFHRRANLDFPFPPLFQDDLLRAPALLRHRHDEIAREERVARETITAGKLFRRQELLFHIADGRNVVGRRHEVQLFKTARLDNDAALSTDPRASAGRLDADAQRPRRFQYAFPRLDLAAPPRRLKDNLHRICHDIILISR